MKKWERKKRWNEVDEREETKRGKNRLVAKQREKQSCIAKQPLHSGPAEYQHNHQPDPLSANALSPSLSLTHTHTHTHT